jgi:MFS transporter, FSR family, fosmidomycin resistance protein
MNDESGAGTSVMRLSAAHIVADIYLPVITAILPLLMATYGFSYFLAGLLVTAYNVTSSVMQPVFGWMSDRFGIVIHVSVSLLISALFISAMGLSGNFYLLLAFAALAALGHAAFHPNALSLVARFCNAGNRGRLLSIFVVGGNLGYAIGPILAALIVTWYGLSGLPLLIIPAAVMALVLWKSFPRKKGCLPAVEEPGPTVQSRLPYLPVFALFSASTLRAWVVFCAIAFFPPLLIARGLSLVMADLLVTGMLLSGVAGQVVAGYLSDRYGRKEFVIAGSLLAVPSFLGFIFLTGPASLVSLMVFGFALWSGLAVMLAMAHEMVPGKVGLTSGIMLGAAMGVGGLGVAVTGVLADTYSLDMALYILPILILAACIIVYFLPYSWKRREKVRVIKV